MANRTATQVREGLEPRERIGDYGKSKNNYKDNTFCALFSEKKNLIELYNALSGSSFDMDTPVEIVTLDNTFFGDRENDLSFIIDNRWIVLAEQQSTLCPNIPLRMLVYVARQYENLVFSRDIYSRKLVKIPTPELYVFYNGPQDAPVEQEMKLSDAFIAECDRIALEMTVKFINVNYEKGAEILKGCKAMNGYSLLLHMIREECEATGELKVARAMKAKGMTINEICEITGLKRSQVEEL